jgi:MOSC domain-containing protein YiiM
MILNGIAIKPVKNGPMSPVKNGFITSTGLEGNYYGTLRNFAQSNRQVTVISLGQWLEALWLLTVDNLSLYPWYLRRANLCVTEHLFGPSDVGKTLMIGTDAALEITGETEPCERMEKILPGLKAALTPAWRGGVTCRVLRAGAIRATDTVSLR